MDENCSIMPFKEGEVHVMIRGEASRDKKGDVIVTGTSFNSLLVLRDLPYFVTGKSQVYWYKYLNVMRFDKSKWEWVTNIRKWWNIKLFELNLL